MVDSDSPKEAKVEVTDWQMGKVEDGDILLVKVDPATTMDSIARFTKVVKAMLADMGVKAQVLVVAGEVSMETVKESKLKEVIEDLEMLKSMMDDVEGRLEQGNL